MVAMPEGGIQVTSHQSLVTSRSRLLIPSYSSHAKKTASAAVFFVDSLIFSISSLRVKTHFWYLRYVHAM